MFSLYIHIPYCLRKCPYCDFYSQSDRSTLDEYIDVLISELKLYSAFGDGKLVSIYWGGGTPSLLAPQQVERVHNVVAQQYSIAPECEITFECNPEQGNAAYFQALQQCGINRLSLGIQSFDAKTLQFLGRRHSVEAATAALDLAQTYFAHVSADIIYGVPGLSNAQLASTLEALCGVEHLSAYHLSIEAATPFGRMHAKGKLQEVDETTSVEQFKLCDSMLRSAGYEHYEISNFARSGAYSVHNMGYWFSRPYVGIGASAHSFDGSRRWWNASNLQEYRTQVLSGVQMPNMEELSLEERWEEWLLTRLRTQWGISLSEGLEAFGAERIEQLQAKAQPFLKSGQLYQQKEQYIIPSEQYLVADAIIRALA